MTGQKTGRDAQIAARLTSIELRTIGVVPYHVGSNVGEVYQVLIPASEPQVLHSGTFQNTTDGKQQEKNGTYGGTRLNNTLQSPNRKHVNAGSKSATEF